VRVDPPKLANCILQIIEKYAAEPGQALRSFGPVPMLRRTVMKLCRRKDGTVSSAEDEAECVLQNAIHLLAMRQFHKRLKHPGCSSPTNRTCDFSVVGAMWLATRRWSSRGADRFETCSYHCSAAGRILPALCAEPIDALRDGRAIRIRCAHRSLQPVKRFCPSGPFRDVPQRLKEI
jgi:hypothetical protein